MSECTEWLWSRTPKGYGSVWYQGRLERAHRVAYCMSKGVPLGQIKGLVVRHTCDNPGCCNPDHLLLGTHADNVSDKYERGRANHAVGQRVAASKLSDDEWDNLLSRYDGSWGILAALAREYGITPQAISYKLRRKKP